MDYSIEKIVQEFHYLKIKKETREKIMPHVSNLQKYHQSTFRHSVRVADLGRQIADFTHIVEPRLLWLPGLVHDLGKICIPVELLNKTINWDERDAELMKKHVEFGCMLLSECADFSALTTFYSHFFKKEGGYPIESDFAKTFGTRFDKWHESDKIKGKYCGRLVSLADTYDAIKTRKNDKFSPGESKLLSSEEAKEIFMQENQDQKFLIENLYQMRIFK